MRTVLKFLVLISIFAFASPASAEAVAGPKFVLDDDPLGLHPPPSNVKKLDYVAFTDATKWANPDLPYFTNEICRAWGARINSFVHEAIWILHSILARKSM